MRANYFLDTNIFIYSFDGTSPLKQKKAQSLISDALAARTGIVSTQVIQEFFAVASRKFAQPLTVRDAQVYLETVFTPLCDVFPSTRLYSKALSLQESTGYHFYDALIVAGALEGGCQILYSEDLQNDRHIDGLQIVNPFRSGLLG